jgi:hypothetical protein
LDFLAILALLAIFIPLMAPSLFSVSVSRW